MTWKEEAKETQFVTYDFRCSKCGKTEERFVRRRELQGQVCSCDGKMAAQFPLGRQLDYECDFKPIYDYVTSYDNKWVTSRGEFRARLKRSGQEQCGDRQGGSPMGKKF